VQVAAPLLSSVVGVQIKPAICAAGETAREAVCDEPLYAAVTMTVCWAVTDAAVATKLAKLPPPVTVTLPGTLIAALLLASDTVAPPVPAGFESVIRQFAAPPGKSAPGEHVKAASCAPASRLIDAVRLVPFRLAVSVAV
jgi:hypothetical protein